MMNDRICDIDELKSKIKHLEDLLSNQDKEVESLRDKLDIAIKALEIVNKHFNGIIDDTCVGLINTVVTSTINGDYRATANKLSNFTRQALAKIKGDK